MVRWHISLFLFGVFTLAVGVAATAISLTNSFGFSEFEQRRMLGAVVLIPLGAVFVAAAIIGWVRDAKAGGSTDSSADGEY